MSDRILLVKSIFANSDHLPEQKTGACVGGCAPKQRRHIHSLIAVSRENHTPASGPLKSTQTAILSDGDLGLICISVRWRDRGGFICRVISH